MLVGVGFPSRRSGENVEALQEHPTAGVRGDTMRGRERPFCRPTETLDGPNRWNVFAPGGSGQRDYSYQGDMLDGSPTTLIMPMDGLEEVNSYVSEIMQITPNSRPLIVKVLGYVDSPAYCRQGGLHFFPTTLAPPIHAPVSRARIVNATGIGRPAPRLARGWAPL
jgi:hypothetical protein